MEVVTVQLKNMHTMAAQNTTMMSHLSEADLISQLVLLILFGMSVACWGIIFKKVKYLHRAHENTEAFLSQFWKAKRLDEVYAEIKDHEDSPVASVFERGFVELERLKRANNADSQMLDGEANLERAMRRAAAEQRTSMEKTVTFLATTGSTAPFIGLFGTVWGILNAFQTIGEMSATTQVTIQSVGAPIAHALIATAVGLAAAIPAVVAYNFINRKIKVLCQEMDNFSNDFLNIIKRNYLSR